MRKEVKILGAIAVVVVVAAFFGANYYRNSVQSVPVTGNSNSGRSSVNNEKLIRPDSPTLGAANAKVTIVEFLDPECESCRGFNPAVKKILQEYDGRVRLVVRYMPFHPNSLKAAAWTEAAGEQGKYWQMQELLFQRQPEWGEKHGPAASSQSKPDVQALFERYAIELKLDLGKMNAALEQHRFTSKITRDQADGQSLGVRQTPTFFVNGRQLARLGDADLKALIEEELKR